MPSEAISSGVKGAASRAWATKIRSREKLTPSGSVPGMPRADPVVRLGEHVGGFGLPAPAAWSRGRSRGGSRSCGAGTVAAAADQGGGEGGHQEESSKPRGGGSRGKRVHEGRTLQGGWAGEASAREDARCVDRRRFYILKPGSSISDYGRFLMTVHPSPRLRCPYGPDPLRARRKFHRSPASGGSRWPARSVR